jgi:hypothetical protein
MPGHKEPIKAGGAVQPAASWVLLYNQILPGAVIQVPAGTRSDMHCKDSGHRALLAAVLALAPLLGAVAAPAYAEETSQPIVASLNPPPAGLNCTDAAAAASVYFQFANPPFQVNQVSLYLDGAGVPQDAVDEHWPTVTLTKGLHPGTNTVDIVANGTSGQHIERRLVVQVGGSAADTGTAQVACDDNAPPQAQQAQQTWDSNSALPDQAPPAVAEGAPPPDTAPPPVAYDDSGALPPAYYDQPAVVYDYPAPAYVYTPYPLVDLGWVPFVPFYSFGFFYSNYHPWFPPPHYGGGWYGGGGWHGGGGWSGGGGWRGGGNGGGWRGNPPVAGGNGGGWRGGAPAGTAPGWRGQAAPSQAAPAQRPGWQGAPAAPRYGRPVAPQGGAYRGAYNGSYGVQVMRGAPSAPAPQYRPAPAAPQFRGGYQPAPQAFRGGGGGGGFHGGGGGSRGGGGRHR